MSLASKRTCPVCREKFDPIVDWQVCCTPDHAVVLRMRRYRARRRAGGGDDGGGGTRQRRLFPKPLLVKTKPPRPAQVHEPTLFETDLLATFGGAVEYAGDGSVSDKNRYSVKPGRKPSGSAPATPELAKAVSA
jgi:hypothetical protein